jgi:hypothetical protein
MKARMGCGPTVSWFGKKEHLVELLLLGHREKLFPPPSI